ncbi:hypothetical protein ACTFIV_005169, partial [Dictyostelium citrinum]
QHQYNSKINL